MKAGAIRGSVKRWHPGGYEAWLDFGKAGIPWHTALPLACYLRRVIVENALTRLTINACYHLTDDGPAYRAQWQVTERPTLGPVVRSLCTLLPRIAPGPTAGAMLTLTVRCQPNGPVGAVFVEITPDYL